MHRPLSMLIDYGERISLHRRRIQKTNDVEQGKETLKKPMEVDPEIGKAHAMLGMRDTSVLAM